jgi:hypothetical protein
MSGSQKNHEPGMSTSTADHTRVSDPSRVKKHSLDAHERLFYEFYKNRGWEPVGVHREEGQSPQVVIASCSVFRQLLEDEEQYIFHFHVVVHTCIAENSGRVHVHTAEGPAVKALLERYAAGTTTRSHLLPGGNARSSDCRRSEAAQCTERGNHGSQRTGE